MRPIVDSDPPTPLEIAYLYGRGQGSTAQEQASINVRIDARVVAALGGRPGTLKLQIEALDGTPIDERREAMGGGDPAGSAGGAGGNAPPWS